MKTLSKYPGIFLLEKGEEYYNSVINGDFVVAGNRKTSVRNDLVPFSGLKEEQARKIVEKQSGPLLLPLNCIDWIKEKLVNPALRQNNEPELREGKRPKNPSKKLTKEQKSAVKFLRLAWINATDPADILIEIPMNQIITIKTLPPKRKNPGIITMCGSTRFSDLMAVISWEFEKLGNIVLRVNYLPEWYGKYEGFTENAHWADQSGLKEELDELHFRKIDLCDRVFVCNLDGYIGESTSNEIAYAKKIGKPIIYMTDQHELSDKIQDIFNWTVKQHLTP